MEVDEVPPALRERLGTEATVGLLAVLDKARKEWTDDVTLAAVDRFERRLTEEGSAFRVALAHTEAKLRTEIAELGGSLRTEIAGRASSLQTDTGQQVLSVRTELAQQVSLLRSDIAGLASKKELHEGLQAVRDETARLGTDLRREMSDLRFSVIKWNFVFWTGQLLVTAAMMGVFLQALR